MARLIISLGSSNDADGRLDAEAAPRAELVLCLFRECQDANRPCRVLPSGGADPDFAFNPTTTPHWQYVSTALLEAGLPESALIQPGLPALHTVDEAIMAREHVLAACGSDAPIDEVVVVTSDFHAARARHLFGVAFGAHAQCPVEARVSDHAGQLMGEALEKRRAHEKKALSTLRSAPFGAWAAFVKEHGVRLPQRPNPLLCSLPADGPLPVPSTDALCVDARGQLEATNRSARHSRRLMPATYATEDLAEPHVRQQVDVN
jgi:hypothetical protein